jgi:adenylate kinase family enzyme
MWRVSVVGNSGSGKTTFARRWAAATGAAHTELDALMWLPGWTKVDVATFRRLASAAVASGSWVVCGNSHAVRDIVWGSADTVVVFDLPRRVVMWRLLRRTVRRWLRREVLWAGNRETLRNVLALRDRERSILAWGWTKHAEYRAEYAAAAADPAWSGVRFVFVRRDRDAEALLATACPSPNAAPPRRRGRLRGRGCPR